MAAEYKKKYRFSSFWPPLLVLAIIVGAGELLTGRFHLLSRTALLLIAALAILLELYAMAEERYAHYSRAFGATIVVVLTITVLEIAGVFRLIQLLVAGEKSIHGALLLISGAYFWASNVLAFSLWYWLIDRGGPHERASGTNRRPGFFFPEMAAGEFGDPNWRPGFDSYFYLAFTNATAFSPTDTLPLSARARFLMTAESVVSLIVIALVLARGVNILK